MEGERQSGRKRERERQRERIESISMPTLLSVALMRQIVPLARF